MSQPVGFYDPERPTAASDIARLIRDRVPGWMETSQGAGHWRFTDPDPDYTGRYVEVEGRDRIVPVTAEPMHGKHVGPSVLGYFNKLTVFVVLPEMSDRSDMLSALAAAEAIDALPAVDGGGSKS
ncbi:hypothetical protein [Nocardia sp. NBC_00511]|uniref:hypothetical protein n=1 Tax=Nocardia sp. NBC_00511 TaxID=2903591 RepID=UPI0030E5B535